MRSLFGLMAAGLCLAFVFVSVLNDDISRKASGSIEIGMGKAAAEVQEIHRKVHGVDSSTSRTVANLETKAAGGGGLQRVVYRVDERNRRNSLEVAEKKNRGKAGGKNPLLRETLEHWNRVLQENGSMGPTPTPSPSPQETQTTVLNTPPPTVSPAVAPSPSTPSVYCKWFGTCSGGRSNWHNYGNRALSGNGSNNDSQKKNSGNRGNSGYSWWRGRTNQGSRIEYHHSVASYFKQGGKRNLETTSKSIPTSSEFSRRHYPEKSQFSAKKGLRTKNVNTKDPKDEKLELDFFIAGFPKCGTTTLLHAFGYHYETSISNVEKCHIRNPKIPDGVAISKLNEALGELDSAPSVKRGIKCPTGIKTAKGLERLQGHSPKARIVIGVRHPVLYFQSHYNYRITEIYNKKLTEKIPPLESLVGNNEWKGVSTDNARFEMFLMQLGKTNMTVNDFDQLLGRPHMAVKPNAFKILMYSIEQLEDTDKKRAKSFRKDMQQFLNLNQPLKPFGHENLNVFVGSKAYPETVNICNDKYKKVRELLVEQGRKTQEWIRNELLASPDVFAGGQEYFMELIETWGYDPCDDAEFLNHETGLEIIKGTEKTFMDNLEIK